MEAVAPRSTSSHCGSLNALDQRVPVLPSTAADAGNDAFSTDDAVAVLPCDSRVAASALCAVPASSAAVRAKAAARMTRTRERERRHVSVCGRSLMPVLSGKRAYPGAGIPGYGLGGEIVQTNVVTAVPPEAGAAVTVTVRRPGVRPVPVISPAGEITRPAAPRWRGKRARPNPRSAGARSRRGGFPRRPGW